MPNTEFAASKFFAWALTVAVAVFSAAGVSSVFMPAALPVAQPIMVISVTAGIVFALCLANCMACHMQRAIAGERKFIGLFWLSAFATLALSLVSVIGVHLGWEQLTLVAASSGLALIPASLVSVGAAVLAVIKPLSQFITEGAVTVERTQYEERRARADQRAKDNRNWGNDTAPLFAATPAPAPAPELRQTAPVVEKTAGAPVVARISPFGVTLTQSEADVAEIASAKQTVRAISAAVLSQGFGAVAQARQPEPAPVMVEEAPAVATLVEVYDGMTARERDALFAARFQECKEMWEAGFDISDIVNEKGWPRRTVRGWIEKLRNDAAPVAVAA